MVADIIRLLHEGVKSGRPGAKVVAWDWSWNMYLSPPYTRLIRKLPPEVILMGDFERGGKLRQAGKNVEVEEYSLSYPGPSRRFRSEAKAAGDRQLWAKLQVNTTHELGCVPNLPLIVSLFRKFKYLREVESSGYMATWHFGCATDTINVYAVKKLSRMRDHGEENAFLQDLAREYFGPSIDSDGVAQTWRGFQRACRHYPLDGFNFVYRSPVSYAIAYPLKLRLNGKPMACAWVENGISVSVGDRLEVSLGYLTLTDVCNLLSQLATGWEEALPGYERALAPATTRKGRERACRELAVATVAGCCFRSTFNIYRWYRVRRHKRTDKLGKLEREIVTDELQNLRRALPLVELHRKLGFHEEPWRHMFPPSAIRRKMRRLRELLAMAP